MKALSKKAVLGRARIAEQEEAKRREEYLASLTEEEREAYLEKEKQDHEKAMKALASLSAMAAAMGKGYSKEAMK